MIEDFFVIIFRFKDRLPYKITTIFLTLLIFIPHILLFIEAYYLDVKNFNGWNTMNLLPTANVSPFIFIMVFFTLFLPKSFKQHMYLLIAMLSLGMIVAGLGEAITYASWERNYFFITVSWFTHFTTAFLGIYLLLSEKIELTIKNCIKASAIIYSTVLFMIIHNAIFDTSFFGLAFNGHHNIYYIIFIPNPYLSAFVYVVGLTGVLIAGYWFLKLMQKIDQKIISMRDKNKSSINN